MDGVRINCILLKYLDKKSESPIHLGSIALLLFASLSVPLFLGGENSPLFANIPPGGNSNRRCCIDRPHSTETEQPTTPTHTTNIAPKREIWMDGGGA